MPIVPAPSGQHEERRNPADRSIAVPHQRIDGAFAEDALRRCDLGKGSRLDLAQWFQLTTVGDQLPYVSPAQVLRRVPERRAAHEDDLRHLLLGDAAQQPKIAEGIGSQQFSIVDDQYQVSDPERSGWS